MLRKKLFINEDCYVEYGKTSNKIFYKNKEVKAYPGGDEYDLFKIHNSQLLAYVKKTVQSNPMDSSPHHGETILFDCNTFKEVGFLSFPITSASTKLDNHILVGVSSLNAISLYDLELQRLGTCDIFSTNIRQCKPLFDNYFVILQETGFSSICSVSIRTFKVVWESYIWGEDVNVLTFLKNQFFQYGRESYHKSYLYLRDKSNKVLQKKAMGYDPQFKDFLLLPDDVTIVATTLEREVYLIHADLNFEKIELNLSKKIDYFVLTEAKNLFAIFEDGEYYDLSEKFSNKKQISDEIFRVTSYPKVLTDIMGDYARRVCFFSQPEIRRPACLTAVSMEDQQDPAVKHAGRRG